MMKRFANLNQVKVTDIFAYAIYEFFDVPKARTFKVIRNGIPSPFYSLTALDMSGVFMMMMMH